MHKIFPRKIDEIDHCAPAVAVSDVEAFQIRWKEPVICNNLGEVSIGYTPADPYLGKDMRAPRSLKFTVVGDKAVGKTSLLKTFVYGTFPDGPYVSTVFPFVEDEEYVYSKSVDYSGASLLLAMWDRVYSTKEDNSLRSLQYDKTHVFLLCFSVADKTSFENIFTIWQREIRKFCCQTCCLLVGLKRDLNPCVTRSMGRDMAQRIGAVSYVECSAKTRDGVKHVFEVAVQTAMGSPPSPPVSKKNNKVCESRLRRLIRLL